MEKDFKRIAYLETAQKEDPAFKKRERARV